MIILETIKVKSKIIFKNIRKQIWIHPRIYKRFFLSFLQLKHSFGYYAIKKTKKECQVF